MKSVKQHILHFFAMLEKGLSVTLWLSGFTKLRIQFTCYQVSNIQVNGCYQISG